MDVRLPDGTVLRGVPDGTTKAELRAKLERNGYDVSQLGEAEKPSFGSQLKAELLSSIPGGFVRGLKDIIDTGAQGLSYMGGDSARVKAMNDAGKAEFKGAQEQAGAGLSDVARIGGNVAATWPIGGVFAKGAEMVRAPAAVVNALRTGGMTTGNVVPKGAAQFAGDLALRSGAGAAVGGASAAMVNPDDAGLGAAIGGAMPMVAPAAKFAGSMLKKGIGTTTGVGETALGEAFKAGKAGGKQAGQFTANMRAGVPMEDVLTMARQNLDELGKQKSTAYRAGMANIKSDKSVLDLSNIGQAADDALGMSLYKGQVKNAPAAKVLQEIKGEIDAWRQLDPAEFHTPEGLDALKQRIGGIVESIPFEQKTALTAANKVYNSIKGEIVQQAPEYAKVMKGYSEASDLIKEIERSLSLGQRASADTAMRKLQSLMRNNVNTSYGYRSDLARQLEQAGGQQIMPALAGQALNDWVPRGIQRAATGTGGAALAITGNLPSAAALAALSSPRLMGESAYGAGKAAGAMDGEMLRILMRAAGRAAPVAAAE